MNSAVSEDREVCPVAYFLRLHASLSWARAWALGRRQEAGQGASVARLTSKQPSPTFFRASLSSLFTHRTVKSLIQNPPCCSCTHILPCLEMEMLRVFMAFPVILAAECFGAGGECAAVRPRVSLHMFSVFTVSKGYDQTQEEAGEYTSSRKDGRGTSGIYHK